MRLPSAKRSSPSSTRDFNTDVTSVGALSASSITKEVPRWTARTSGESFQIIRPSSRDGERVNDPIVESRCNWMYSLSMFAISANLSVSLFLPTPWEPRSKKLRSPLFIEIISSLIAATWLGISINSGLGTNSSLSAFLLSKVTSPMATLFSSTTIISSPDCRPDFVLLPALRETIPQLSRSVSNEDRWVGGNNSASRTFLMAERRSMAFPPRLSALMLRTIRSKLRVLKGCTPQSIAASPFNVD